MLGPERVGSLVWESSGWQQGGKEVKSYTVTQETVRNKAAPYN